MHAQNFIFDDLYKLENGDNPNRGEERDIGPSDQELIGQRRTRSINQNKPDHSDKKLAKNGATEATTSRKSKAGEDGDKGSTASRGRNPNIGRLSPKRSDKQNSTLSLSEKYERYKRADFMKTNLLI